MLNIEQIEIPISRVKSTAMLAGSLVFIAIGLWFSVRPPVIDNAVLGNPMVLRMAGIASILFFGWMSGMLVKKVFKKSIGLTINHIGIIDNSGGLSVGEIPWEDIIDVNTNRIANQQFLMVFVKNPEEYIHRQTNFLKRKTMEINFTTYGSPITISANTLQCNFDELTMIIQTYLKDN